MTDHEISVSSSSQVILDALPYIDAFSEQDEERALELIEKEMLTMTGSRQFPPLKELRFRTDLMKAEYEAVATSNAPRQPEILEPTLPDPPLDESDVEQWKDVVRRAKISYEYERLRAIRLEVEKEGDGSAAVMWKAYNDSLQSMQESMHKEAVLQHERVEILNLSRQQSQQQYGQQLQVLTEQYQEALQQHFQLQRAIADLETELSNSKTNE